MSIIAIKKKCPHCGYPYTENPSVGRFLPLCPRCGKRIGNPPSEEAEKEAKEKRRPFGFSR